MNFECKELRDLAKDQHCTLQIRGVCLGNTETTVWCHSPWMLHGKGGSLKSHDCFGCFGCRACHDWLDSRSHKDVPKAERIEAFRCAMDRTWLAMWITGLIGVVKHSRIPSARRREPTISPLPKILPRYRQ